MNRITDIDWDSVWGIDLEANDLLTPRLDTFHILCAYNPKRKERKEFTCAKKARQFLEEESGKGRVFVGHNIVKYDRPALNALTGFALPLQQVVDTLILSQLYNPDLHGGHSLESWGVRLNQPKVGTGIEDWSKLTEEMAERCRVDAILTVRIYASLAKRLKQIDFSELSIDIQHKIYTIILRQQLNGFKLDREKTERLVATIKPELDRIEKDVHTLFPPSLKVLKEGQYRLKRDGSIPERIFRVREENEIVEEDEPDKDGTIKYRVFHFQPFNLQSAPQRVQRLQSLGWEPTVLTPKGNPKVTEDSVFEFVERTGHQEAKEICKWLAYRGRANNLNTWLEAYNEDTGCIHGQLLPAATLRFRHFDPNTANIPGVKVDKQGHPLMGEAGLYTYESRDCWTTRDPEKRVLCGVDAKGLEFRMLAHEINDMTFTEQVVEGDIHTFMQGVYEYPEDKEFRATSKTTSYAIIYGGQDKKIGSISGGTAADGARIRANAFRNLPGLGDAVDRVTKEFYGGRISLCDGSKILCKAKHAALNYKLQGGGARLMAVAAINLQEKLHKEKIDALKVGDIHDEWQFDVLKEHVETFKKLALSSFVEAGKLLKLNCPMAGDVKVGLTWAETH